MGTFVFIICCFVAFGLYVYISSLTSSKTPNILVTYLFKGVHGVYPPGKLTPVLKGIMESEELSTEMLDIQGITEDVITSDGFHTHFVIDLYYDLLVSEDKKTAVEQIKKYLQIKNKLKAYLTSSVEEILNIIINFLKFEEVEKEQFMLKNLILGILKKEKDLEKIIVEQSVSIGKSTTGEELIKHIQKISTKLNHAIEFEKVAINFTGIKMANIEPPREYREMQTRIAIMPLKVAISEQEIKVQTNNGLARAAYLDKTGQAEADAAKKMLIVIKDAAKDLDDKLKNPLATATTVAGSFIARAIADGVLSAMSQKKKGE